MVNGSRKPPFTIYYLPFTNRLLLLPLLLLLGGGGGGGGRVGRGALVLFEQRVDGLLVGLRGLDVSLVAEVAQVLLALGLGPLLRQHAADEVLLEGLVALVDAQDHVALVGLEIGRAHV